MHGDVRADEWAERMLSLIARWDLIQGLDLPEFDFNSTALELYRYQRDANPLYGAWVEAGAFQEPGNWKEIPALPAAAFKQGAVRCFPAELTAGYFLTSGTTQGETGRHEFSRFDVYEAALLATFTKLVVPSHTAMDYLFLTPPPAELPHSSLVHMMETLRRRLAGMGSAYYVKHGRVQVEELVARLRLAMEREQPVALLGTAFSWVHLLDSLAVLGESFLLPEGSFAVETGGFKGRSREVTRDELYELIGGKLGLPATAIVNEYGMTELSSQFYDGTRLAGKPEVVKSGPPWMRAVVVDPVSGREVEDREQALIRMVDLANVGSVLALQTEDVGIRRGDRFEVVGRVPQATRRGCSVGADDYLGPVAGSLPVGTARRNVLY